MPLFHYRAISPDGKPVAGKMQADSQESVVRQLQASGCFPISATLKVSGLEVSGTIQRWRERRARPRPRDVTAITRELSTLLTAGIPIDSSLRILNRNRKHPGVRTVLSRIHDDVQSGKSLSKALGAHRDVFDPLYRSLVQAGEAGGALKVVMQRLADHRERSDEFRASFVASITYPITLLAVAILSLFVLVTFVVPRFIPLFDDAGAPLPLLTRLVFSVSTFFQGYWWLPAGLAIAFAVGARRWLSKPENRRTLHARVLRTPVAGEVVRLTDTVRFTRTLATLLGNGMPLLGALELAKQTMQNVAMVEAVSTCIDTVRSGGRLADSLARQAVFPSLAIELIAIGEESGQLEGMLERASETFESMSKQKLKQLLTLLEPVLILGLGAMIALVIVAILMAMLGLNELIA